MIFLMELDVMLTLSSPSNDDVFAVVFRRDRASAEESSSGVASDFAGSMDF